MRLNFEGIGQTWKPYMNPGPQKESKWLRELHQRKYAIARISSCNQIPPELLLFKTWRFWVNHQEAKIESQQAETQKSSKRFWIDAGLSLNNWVEVNLTSVPGVFVVNSVVTSTSSGSRILEPATTRLLQAEGDLELVKLREHSMPIAAPNTPVTVHNSFPTTSLPLESTEATGTDPDYGGPIKEISRTNDCGPVASSDRI